MGMEGKNLAGEGKSRESHNGTSYLRKELKLWAGAAWFPWISLDESRTCLSSLLFEPKYC